MSEKRLFTAKEAVDITGVSYRKIDYWISRKVISATGKKSNGKGSTRLFRFTDLIEIKVVNQLVSSGARLPAIKTCIKFIRDNSVLSKDVSALATHKLVTNGKDVFKYIPDKDILETMNENCGQYAFSFGVEKEVSQVRDKVFAGNFNSRYERESTLKNNTNLKGA